MSLLNQQFSFVLDFVLAQRPPDNGFILGAEGTVSTFVGAKVRYVEWGKKHQSFAVNRVFDVVSCFKQLMQLERVADAG